MNDNPATVRVYYDEDVDRTEDDIREELVTDIFANMEHVTDISVEQVFTSTSDEAIVEVEYDGTEIDSEELIHNISTLPYVHNAKFDN